MYCWCCASTGQLKVDSDVQKGDVCEDLYDTVFFNNMNSGGQSDSEILIAVNVKCKT